METENPIVLLDTHLVVWLYDGRLEMIPKPVREILETREIGVSPIVSLELQYLYESGKIRHEGGVYLNDLQTRISLQMCSDPFWDVIHLAERESWTRDPFDRILTAHARLRKTLLVTKDTTIRKNYSHAFW